MEGAEVEVEGWGEGSTGVGRAGVEDPAEVGTATATPSEVVVTGTGGEMPVMGILTTEAEADPPGVLGGVITGIVLFCC